MPSRLIREGILTSCRVDMLDAAEEVFYRRLMSKVDDHGLYDARLSILRASLYPLRVDRVREADCSRWIAACEKAGLIVLYEAGGKPYLKVLDTRWKSRSEPKYPLPPEGIEKQSGENSCEQLKTPVALDVVGDGDGDGSHKARKRASRCPESFTVSDVMAQWAVEQGLPADRVIPETEKFLDHWRANGTTKLDWDATWRNWVRKAVEYTRH